jgi:hypothetical protein
MIIAQFGNKYKIHLTKRINKHIFLLDYFCFLYHLKKQGLYFHYHIDPKWVDLGTRDPPFAKTWPAGFL